MIVPPSADRDPPEFGDGAEDGAHEPAEDANRRHGILTEPFDCDPYDAGKQP